MELMRIRRDVMKTVKIGEKEFQIKTIKGESALDLLSMGGEKDKIKDILKLTIEYGSNAEIKDLSTKEILQLVSEINDYNGFNEDFTKALEKKESGK